MFQATYLHRPKLHHFYNVSYFATSPSPSIFRSTFIFQTYTFRLEADKTQEESSSRHTISSYLNTPSLSRTLNSRIVHRKKKKNRIKEKRTIRLISTIPRRIQVFLLSRTDRGDERPYCRRSLDANVLLSLTFHRSLRSSLRVSVAEYRGAATGQPRFAAASQRF